MLAGQLDKLPSDVDDADVEIDVTPPEGQSLSATEPCGGDRLEQRAEFIAGHVVEQATKFPQVRAVERLDVVQVPSRPVCRR